MGEPAFSQRLPDSRRVTPLEARRFLRGQVVPRSAAPCSSPTENHGGGSLATSDALSESHNHTDQYSAVDMGATMAPYLRFARSRGEHGLLELRISA
jgi:hypothetical protein